MLLEHDLPGLAEPSILLTGKSEPVTTLLIAPSASAVSSSSLPLPHGAPLFTTLFVQNGTNPTPLPSPCLRGISPT